MPMQKKVKIMKHQWVLAKRKKKDQMVFIAKAHSTSAATHSSNINNNRFREWNETITHILVHTRTQRIIHYNRCCNLPCVTVHSNTLIISFRSVLFCLVCLGWLIPSCSVLPLKWFQTWKFPTFNIVCVLLSSIARVRTRARTQITIIHEVKQKRQTWMPKRCEEREKWFEIKWNTMSNWLERVKRWRMVMSCSKCVLTMHRCRAIYEFLDMHVWKGNREKESEKDSQWRRFAPKNVALNMRFEEENINCSSGN